jgi:hypothetical protein
MTDIATALTNSLASDGQTPATGNLNLNNNKIVNLAAGTVAGNSVEFAQFSTPTFTGDVTCASTGFIQIPKGTTAQRPVSPAAGEVRFNTTSGLYEGYSNSAWTNLGGGAAGSNTQVQYNSSGLLAGSAALTFNGTTLATTTLSSTNLSDGTNTTSTTNCIQGSAKAWVNFNGTATPTIRASFNVSSVTYSATGKFTVNFTTAMTSANYAFAISGGSPSANTAAYGTLQNSIAPTSSALAIGFLSDAGVFVNATYASATVFSS